MQTYEMAFRFNTLHNIVITIDWVLLFDEIDISVNHDITISLSLVMNHYGLVRENLAWIIFLWYK